MNASGLPDPLVTRSSPMCEEGGEVLRPWRFIRLLTVAVVLSNLAALLLGRVSLYDSHQRAEELARQ